MVNSTRRQFLRRSGALAVASALSACGAGAGSAGTTSAASATSGSQADTSAAMITSVTTATTPLTNANFTLTSATAQSRAPYTLGYAFQKGDVPAGSSVTADAGTLQVIPKNTWPDGSLKFAVLSGIVDLAANTPKTINLSRAPLPAAATALDLVRLRFTNITAQIGAGSFGTVSWSGADWSSPFATWVSGPVMSSWIYRKPVGTDPHLVAWLEVRVYNNGMVEVLPWIENGYLQVAGPTNKSAHYTFTLGGTQRFAADIDLKHHQRTPLIAGAALSYWLAADASVTPKHNRTYLQATELVPSYLATVSASSVAVQGLVASYQPLQAGNFNYDGDSMAASGYQDPIGLLPQHDVLYLTSDASQAYGAVVRNGFSAGRWGIHYRDETTNRPLRFSSHPNLNIGDNQGFKDTGGSTRSQYTPAPTGGNPPGWDVAHSPSVGYLAYLVTGRWYFMEEVQFATTANYLGNGDNNVLRDGAKGLVQPCTGAWQTRACAWDWRARIQALAVTPDDDTALRSEFIASVEANIAHFYGRYVAQANNPFGWVKPGETYEEGLRTGAPWQQDFVTATFGYALSLGLPVSSTAAANLAAFFQWKAKSVVMRLGQKGAFWYVNGDPYNTAITPSTSPDYENGTGPWYTSDAEVYAATFATPPFWFGSTEGVLAGEIMPGERAMWGNLMPAIAYAVRHGVAGASAGFNRLTSASNWGVLRDAFNQSPVWAVQPAKMTISSTTVAAPAPVPVATTGTPAWLVGAAVGQWIEIPGTAGAGGASVDAYSGFTFKESTNEILIAVAGGHSDSADNRVVSLSLMSNAPIWTVLMAASTSVATNVPYYPDGKPTSRHLYNTIQYIPQLNRVMLFGVKSAYGNAYDFAKVDAFNLDTNTWDSAGTWADMPAGHLGAVTVRATGEVWSTGLARWSPATKTWTQPITTRTSDLVRFPIAHDSLRNQLFTLNWGDGWGYGTAAVFASVVPCTGSAQVSIKFNPSAALNSFMAEQPSYAAMDYDPDNDRFLFYCGMGSAAGRVYVIKPNSGTTWDISILPISGSKLPPATVAAGLHNRFRYVPALKGFVMMPSASSNLFFIRTA